MILFVLYSSLGYNNYRGGFGGWEKGGGGAAFRGLDFTFIGQSICDADANEDDEDDDDDNMASTYIKCHVCIAMKSL